MKKLLLPLFASLACAFASGARTPAPELAVQQPRFDCNDNGIEDSVDIALGASSDQNQNGVPDECEADGPRERAFETGAH